MALILVLHTLAGCNAAQNRQTAGGEKVEVELDAFSGRRNPIWELTADQAKTVMAAIGSAPEADARVAAPGLGYRGFVLHSGEQSIRVFRGLISIEEHGKTRTLRDNANVEAGLAADARSRGYGEIVKGVPAPH